MKAPDFWEKGKGGLRSAMLAPFGVLYGMGATIRRALATPIRVGVPVLCVGNVTAGGAGKTPVVITLAEAAKAKGLRAVVVSRGYGGSLAGPVRVDPRQHSAADVGDEPLLIARHAETWVAKDRVAGARAAVAAGAELIMLDDGFQNPTLHKDLSVIVIDGAFGLGNGRVMPAGPLREPLSGALKRADLVLLMGRDYGGIRAMLPPGMRVEGAQTLPQLGNSLAAGDKCVAFAGIGLPAKFFVSLRDAKLDVLAEHAFPDHFMYSFQDLDRLGQEATAKSAKLVTTAKDHVRLPPQWASRVEVLEITVEFERRALPAELISRVTSNG